LIRAFCLQISDIAQQSSDPADPRLPSLTNLIPGADWHEWEVYDVLGIVPDGHPDPRRLVVADDWPEDVFPLRKDVAYNLKPPRVTEIAVSRTHSNLSARPWGR
jgi:Ni,Fe-hydrogenase III component G